MNHPLVKLAGQLDWKSLRREVAPSFCDDKECPGLRPGIVGPKGLNRFGVLDPVAVSKVVGRAMHDDLAPCVLYLDIRQCSRTAECQESPVGAIDIAMKPFHEWLAMREGLWLNDKNSVIGLSRLNPLPKNSAVNKSLVVMGVEKGAS
ncbi:MAG: hypothetical protein NT142_09010 [Planctomycetota bacterium]|nr:hypothetical protein [Planctomycetota bacterium]